ncbi:ribonuclease HI [Devosia sp.]|uniref:ribonuclease HI n=1 Tax=Devosia sp. TaxID=1871048 RepID=UPI001AC720AC|nr:ribonuclease HI [Devosia sp.]MBN9333009.1 ribonuclease HI [Devosia sp.]
MNSSGRHLVLATDGACLGNPGPGGWAVVIHEHDNDTVVCRSALAGHAVGDTTNNQMELQAAIEAVRYAKTLGLPAVITTDSQYVQRGITEWLPNWKDNGWRTSDRKSVKNRDLWQALDALVADHPVKWRWVKAHSGHIMNEAADELAKNAAWRLVSTKKKLRYFHPKLFSKTSEVA